MRVRLEDTSGLRRVSTEAVTYSTGGEDVHHQVILPNADALKIAT